MRPFTWLKPLPSHFPIWVLYTGDLWSVFGEVPLHSELQVWLKWNFGELCYSCLWLENLARSSLLFFCTWRCSCMLESDHVCLKVIRHACSTSRVSKLKYSRYCRVLKSIVWATKSNKNHLKLISSNLMFHWCIHTNQNWNGNILWACQPRTYKLATWSEHHL